MKKLLSVVLALAMIASCFIVGTVVSAEEETPNAVKISNNAVTSAGSSDFLMKAPFLTAADFGEEDTLDVTYLILNPFDKEIDFKVFATEWDSYRDTVYTTNEIDPETNKPSGEKVARTDSILIPANTVGEVTVTYAKTGYFYHSNASILFATGNYLDKMAFRIQCGNEVL
ncbi:MAG: hypothetical protein IKM06_03370, partial [Clostridia bacterium]|nr:hypothetical protein [Clostridia bacterium]